MNFINKRISFYIRPEYIFRPKQLIWHIKQKLRPKPNEFESVNLPWGAPIRIRPFDFIGIHIWWYGVYDLCVSEAIWRLLDPGDYAVDVGANIGYTASIMATKVGADGQVLCFEPHPEIYEELSLNINNWQKLDIGIITAKNIALGDHAGKAVLNIPECFNTNRGLASITYNLESVDNKEIYDVQVEKLDELFKNNEFKISLLKIDVEGHEFQVLKGATNLLRNQQIRDILFEEFADYPSPVTDFLEEHGYSLFYLGKNFSGLDVGDIKTQKTGYHAHNEDPPSFLATIFPERAILKLKQNKGWSILMPN